jgi:hypothetical protein
MSFSFRNIFSPDDSESEAAAAEKGPGGFSAPGGVPAARGGLSGAGPTGGPAQSFLVSELLPYIPKAIAAQSGIPMSKELKVPVPADGSLDVRLSTLYQICPELFAAEITPLNDSVVTLPPRLGATPETPAVPAGSGWTRPSAGGAGATDAPSNPFWSPVSPGSSSQAAAPSSFNAPVTEKPAAPALSDAVFSWSSPPSAKENPFSSPAKENPSPAESAAAGNSFFAPGTPPPIEAPKFAGGFDAPMSLESIGGVAPTPGAAPAHGFSGVFQESPGKGDGGKADGPARNPFEGSAGFATLFSKQAEVDSGIPYPHSHAAAAAGAPVSSTEPEGVWGAMFSGSGFGDEADQEMGGSGTAPFENIGKLLNLGKTNPPDPVPSFGAVPGEPAFSGFGPGAKTPPAAPKSETATEFAFAAGFSAFAPASADEPTEGSPVAAPSSAPLAGFHSSPVDPEPSAPAMSPAFSPFAAFQGPPPPPVIETAPAPVFAPASRPMAEPQSTTVPETPVGEDRFPQSQAFGTPDSGSEPVTGPAAMSVPFASPHEEKPGDAPVSSFTSFTPAFAHPLASPAAGVAGPYQAPVVPEIHEETIAEGALPVTAGDAPVATPTAPAAPSDDDELRDLELRAIFSTSESFTFSMVARRVVALPGINSCSLSAPGKLIQASRREETRLGNEARDMVATLRSLAKLTGLPEARTFTLQTDRGIVSLFLEGDCCVTVHHDSAAFPPGVREKLILVARSLAKLRE